MWPKRSGTNQNIVEKVCLRALEIITPAPFLTRRCCKKQELESGRRPRAPSRLVGGGVCLYDAVVFCGDPGPGLRQFRLLQFAFLIGENLPAAEEEKHAK